MSCSPRRSLPDWLVYSDHVLGSGHEFYRQACGAGLEGVVSKLADSKYVSGRTKSWLKTKCHQRAELVIGGYSRSSVRGRPFSSLLLGTFENGELIYAGKVGTGFSSADLDALAKRFKPLEQRKSSFVEVPAIERKDAVWLKPKLVCEVEYTEWTRDGRLRHPSFQGLREDKPAADVRRDVPSGEEAELAPAKSVAAKAKAKAKGDPVFDGITLTSPDKVLYPEVGVTKLDLASYYQTIAPYILPYVVNRPISLVRCPEGIEGERFFQRHAMKGMSDAIKQIPISGGESKKPYLYLDGEAGLFGLVQISTVEIHDWGVSLDHLYEPDRLVFDLDPDEGLDIDVLKAAAVEVRDFLADLGLEELPEIDRRQGPARGGADRAEARLGRGEGLRQGHRRCAGRGARRPLYGQPAEADAGRQDLRRLSAQSTGRVCHRQLFDAGEAQRFGRLPACLGRAEGPQGRKPLHAENAAHAAQSQEKRPLGGVLLHPPIDHGKGEEGARA